MRISTILIIGLFCRQAAADEPFDWRIVGPSTVANSGDEPLSWTVVGPCHCHAGGECTCGLHCQCRPPAEPKPVAFAYKDFNLICPGCAQLAREADDLPVRLEWKPAPAWVRSYPTLHWRGDDGYWYQYQWGRNENDVAGFRRAWEATRGQSALTATAAQPASARSLPQTP